eukprot:TRINITY_DN500_c0_g1_i5.p1 TRINITY_DN500_c0_g1~~TRINITY_DN500_c0_g1_i5.p1  ORF type:complete len:389 (-),score=56.46 TRINITY_DN500_c0_g1_i5:149-1315(-)
MTSMYSLTLLALPLFAVGIMDHRTKWLRGNADEPSFAVFTRVIGQELPYISSFVQHYDRLGARRFYLLSNKKDELRAIQTYLQDQKIRRVQDGTDVKYRFLHKVGGADDILASPELLMAFTEDYIVGVDADEYWLLPAGITTFAQLARVQPADIWYASWRVVPNDQLRSAPLPPYKSFRMNRTKWIAKRQIIKSLRSIHIVSTLDGPHRIRRETGELVHFIGRNFLDAVAKGLAQFFRDGTVFPVGNGTYHGCEGLITSVEMVRNGTLPMRLKLLAIMMEHPVTDVIESESPLLQINHTVESKMLHDLLNSSAETNSQLIWEWRDYYFQYRQCLQERLASNTSALSIVSGFAPKGAWHKGVEEANAWLETVPCGGVWRKPPSSLAFVL